MDAGQPKITCTFAARLQGRQIGLSGMSYEENAGVWYTNCPVQWEVTNGLLAAHPFHLGGRICLRLLPPRLPGSHVPPPLPWHSSKALPCLGSTSAASQEARPQWVSRLMNLHGTQLDPRNELEWGSFLSQLCHMRGKTFLNPREVFWFMVSAHRGRCMLSPALPR